MFDKLRFVSSFVAVGVAAVSGLGACSTSQDEGDVEAKLEVIDKTKSALTAASISAINGTYGGACNGRAAGGTDAWVFDRSTPANTTLSVVKNDSDCVLTLTSIVTPLGTFLGSPAISMNTTDAYKTSGSAFALSAGPLAFYGNAKISALSFGANFTMSLLVSDAPSVADQGNHASSFATTTATVAAATVPAPTYTVGFGSFVVSKADGNIVDSVGGYAQLTAGATSAENYAIYEGVLTSSSTLAEVETAWGASTTTGTVASLTSLQLPAAGFNLVGKDLDNPTQRTIILRHTVDGVSSYQLLTVTFV